MRKRSDQVITRLLPGSYQAHTRCDINRFLCFTMMLPGCKLVLLGMYANFTIRCTVPFCRKKGMRSSNASSKSPESVQQSSRLITKIQTNAINKTPKCICIAIYATIQRCNGIPYIHISIMHRNVFAMQHLKKTIFCNICSIPAELTEKESTNLEKTAAPAAVASTERQMSACQLVIQSRLGPSQPNTAQRNTKIWNNITMQWDSNESGKLSVHCEWTLSSNAYWRR